MADGGAGAKRTLPAAQSAGGPASKAPRAGGGAAAAGGPGSVEPAGRDTSSGSESEERYHPGEAECDFDSFEDWDERCHGPMDSKVNRRQFPESFLWSCCGGALNSRGCEARKPGEPRVPGDTGSVSSDTKSGLQREGHPGELEVVWDEWPDHDERVHGEIDTAANRRDFPDGFRWDCCGGRANAPGCAEISDEGEEEVEDSEE